MFFKKRRKEIMSKNSLVDQVIEAQTALEKLNNYEKLFDKACKISFGYNSKTIKKIIENNEEPCSSFESKMRTFFGLKTDKDVADFVAVMCTENSLNFFKNKRVEESV